MAAVVEVADRVAAAVAAAVVVRAVEVHRVVDSVAVEAALAAVEVSVPRVEAVAVAATTTRGKLCLRYVDK